MYFNDGTDPWRVEENHIRVFDFSKDQYNVASTNMFETNLFGLVSLLLIVYHGL